MDKGYEYSFSTAIVGHENDKEWDKNVEDNSSQRLI
jgi:hypothetical protein